jgi:hypothetical protein
MKTGVSSQIRNIMPGIRPGLVAAVLGSAYGKPHARRELRTFNGKHEVVSRGDAANDALILEIRRLHEQVAMPPFAIHRHIELLGHIKTRSWVSQCCNYHNRSFLVPAANAASYLTATESTTA